jgi:type IV pilus assembly protein PilC
MSTYVVRVVEKMAQSYAYRARNAAGNIITGFVEAEGVQMAGALLRQRNYFIIEIKSAPAKGREINLSDFMEKKIGLKHMAIFCRQFATLVEAGVPILNCLDILRQQTESKKLKEVLAKMAALLEEGRTLTDAVRQQGEVFPHIFYSMIEAGEVGGVLEQSLERLATHFEKEHELREKIKSAMTYPAVVIIIAALAIYALLAFILPKFVSMLVTAGVTLPLPTRIVMFISSVLSRFWYLVIGGTAAAVFLFGRFRRTKSGREVVDRLVFRLPVFGPLQKKVIISRFARTLSTLIHAGVPILQSLEVMQSIVGNQLVVKAVKQAETSISEGRGLAEPLAQSGVFPPMVTRMIAIGEETGALENMLEKIAAFYDREVEATVARLSAALEPILIVGMGAVIGFIIISIMLPILNVMSGSTVQ